MIDPDARLAENVFDTPAQAATRDGFGKGLVAAAEADPRVVALSADLTESTRVEEFRAKFPERFVEVGVAE
ncbi:MAG: transketolase family protein, partial [Candidatus Kaiserbacteria bacterium]|nr:transketolase family protein [Candidatus Kaiserbacteria bacterium]